MSIGELVGFAAGGIGILNGIPQARRVRTLGHGTGVSLSSWMLIAATNSAWFGYGVRVGAPSIIVSNILSLAVTVVVVFALCGISVNTAGQLAAIFAVATLGATQLPEAIVSVVMVVFTLSRAPQVVHSWRSKRDGIAGTAVSMSSLAISVVSLLLWEAYAVLEHRPFLVLTTTVAMTTTLAVAWLEQTNTATPALAPADQGT